MQGQEDIPSQLRTYGRVHKISRERFGCEYQDLICSLAKTIVITNNNDYGANGYCYSVYAAILMWQ